MITLNVAHLVPGDDIVAKFGQAEGGMVTVVSTSATETTLTLTPPEYSLGISCPSLMP